MGKRIYLSPPHLNGNEMRYVQEAFDTNWIAPLGPHVDAFEQELCDYVGVQYGLALSSGTAGIHLALRYFNVCSGDYVFCSSLTFAGSCNPVIYQNARPVFIDSEPASWNMSPTALERAFAWAKKENKLPKAVIIVDLYGQSADWDMLLPICKNYSVPVIEDAAEALGATYKGQKCGSFGDVGVFSFNGNKIITTSGGGMIITNNRKAIDKMRFWSSQARENELHYEHKEYGYNYRLSNICAGIGRGQLASLTKKIEAKRKIYYRYKEDFKGLPISMMPIFYNGEPNYWLSVITIKQDSSVHPRDVINQLQAENIEARPVWKPMHMQPVFADCTYFKGTDDIAKNFFETGVCLPSGSSMTKEEQDRIIKIIISCFGRDYLTVRETTLTHQS